MMNNGITLIVLLIINILIVAFYCIFSIVEQRENNFSIISKAVVMLLCPFAGALFILIGFIFYKIFSPALDLDDVVFSKERKKVYMHADEERGRNIVSVEEALAVTDKMNLRNLMMNVVKGNVKESLGSISLALNGEDSETSHYAASVLQDELNDFRARVQKEHKELQEICNNIDENAPKNDFPVTRAIELLHFMNIMLIQKVLTKMEQKSMVEIMNSVAHLIYRYAKASLSSHDYEAVCLRLLEEELYDECKLWCERSSEDYPMALSTYTCKMKLYYYTDNREELFSTMNELRNSNVVIDNETLEIIRCLS